MVSSRAKIGLVGSIISLVVLFSTFLLTGFIGTSTVFLAGVISGQQQADSSQRKNSVFLEIEYFNNWNVTLSENFSTKTWSGFGKSEKILYRPDVSKWVISVKVQKMDGSTGLLVVRLKQSDGSLLQEAFTTKPYGIANILLEIS